MSARRLWLLLAFLVAVGLPAVLLQVLCVGSSCDAGSSDAPRVPFCSLPEATRRLIANGYREGRSPDVLGITSGATVWSEAGGTGVRVPWPGARSASTAVPLVFAGVGVRPGVAVPDGVTLDRVAPTVAGILGFDRPFPEVRSGGPIPGVVSDADGPPRLVLLIAWKGVGGTELEAREGAWPFLASLFRDGAGTLVAASGSLPADPAAVLTTIGTGGLPSQHGITASLVRNDEGEVVPAFDEDAPVHVIATLADDLEAEDRRTLVALVGTDPSDRGLVGGGWHPDQDPVDTIIGGSGAASLAVRTLLGVGFGTDDVTDVVGVVMDGPVRALDRWTRAIARSADRATGGSVLVVVAGTGSPASDRLAIPSTDLIETVEEAVPGDAPVVAAAAAGGLFLDREALTRAEITGQVVADALVEVSGPEGERMMADAFQGFAVSFARYC
ncbi:MAG TPA: hypothetical protein VF029_04830 [Actinomycetota bacterium]